MGWCPLFAAQELVLGDGCFFVATQWIRVCAWKWIVESLQIDRIVIIPTDFDCLIFIVSVVVFSIDCEQRKTLQL